MKQIYLFIYLVLCFAAFACNSKPTQNSDKKEAYQKISPDFNPDSAYMYVDKQVSFGARVPGTLQHVSCGNYLADELKRFGADVTEQKGTVKIFDGTSIPMRNIIGAYNPEKKDRILLFAHWDTRPFADHDPNPDNHHKHILGANDAASGIGVLLEIARNLQMQPAELGVDIIFFDVEDYGPPSFLEDHPDGDWWCLGSQYWSKNPHIANYTARYGILLDMVGAPDAKFFKEGYSVEYSGNVVANIWSTAYNLGYGNHFVNKQGGYITDDHVPVIQYRNIQAVDIIQHDPSTESGFAAYWHTLDDGMHNIDRNTLRAVGQTVMEVIYKEK